MSYPTKGDVLTIPVHSGESEQNLLEIPWTQDFKMRTARYYLVKAQNQSKGGADVLFYIQDNFYRDPNSMDYIGKLPDARQEDNSWIVNISERFQYGEKDKNGDGRWVCLHDRRSKPIQHRFLVMSIQSKISQPAKNLAMSFGAGEMAHQIGNFGRGSGPDLLHTF